MERLVDVLVPTCGRAGALAVTLTGLVGQRLGGFRVVVSDQTEGFDVAAVPEVAAAARVLRHQGRPVEVHRHLPRRGLAEQRQFLLDRARAPYALFLDDDVLLEPDVLDRLLAAIRREGCGFVGAFPDAPSAVDSTRPADQPPPGVGFELWDGPVHPERVEPGLPGWERRHLHFAAHPHRLAARHGLTRREPPVLYKVAWVGGCVLFDAARLRAVGGFSFWEELPPDHSGEDVTAQQRVMAAFGGAGMVPSGAWHQEVPTTVRERGVDAPYVVGLLDEAEV